LLSNCATDPCLDFFVYLSVMYFTSYRAFSSFHQHNFVSLSLSFCADVTGFVTEKTYGTRETKGGKILIRTLLARNRREFHSPTCPYFVVPLPLFLFSPFLSLTLSFLFPSFSLIFFPPSFFFLSLFFFNFLPFLLFLYFLSFPIYFSFLPSLFSL
jgi:hypothetical protein